ncbi:MAG: STAS domain-containing protein [Actinomycetota bacterium]|nr:STAS domain-containing protein [Actinomycetota bacterium]
MELSLASRTEGPWSVVEVRGEVDLATAPQLRESVLDLIDDGSHQIVVDLRGVDFMDSSGLGVLMTALKRLREYNGDLALVCREGPVLKVLSITGLDRVFPIYHDVAEATAS